MDAYLERKRLKACVEREHPGIQVLQPDDAWAAIVKYGILPHLSRDQISYCCDITVGVLLPVWIPTVRFGGIYHVNEALRVCVMVHRRPNTRSRAANREMDR